MDNVGSILDVVKSAGPYIFVILWWFERQERRDVQTENKELTKEFINSVNDVKNALRAVSNVLGAHNGDQ